MVSSKGKARKTKTKVRALPVKSSKDVKGGMRKAGGDPKASGQPFLRFHFDTVFTTK